MESEPFNNIVRNEQGVALAGFLSSIGAREYAQGECNRLATYLTVTDWIGFVTEHRCDCPVRIIGEPVGHEWAAQVVADARRNITDFFPVKSASQVAA